MASLVKTHHLSTRHRPASPSPPPCCHSQYSNHQRHHHSQQRLQEQRPPQEQRPQGQQRRAMQSIPAYHDPRGHISPMATRRVGRDDLPRPGSSSSSSSSQATMESGCINNNDIAATGTAVHGVQFAVQAQSTAIRGAGGPSTINQHSTTVSSGTQMYALYGSGALPVGTTNSYNFGSSSSNGGSGMSAIPDPSVVNSTGASSTNKIRIPASVLRALSIPTSQRPETSNSSNSGSCSSSYVSKPSASSSNRDRGAIRTTLPSTGNVSGNVSGTPGKVDGSSGKPAQQVQQQQQPKDRQSFHASLIELFTRDKKALLCPKCHQEGNIHRDGICEGKMRFTCNTMVPAPTGKRRKCNKHFYERAMHSMLVEIVYRKQHLRHQQQHQGSLAIATPAVVGFAGADMSDVEGGGFHTDMSSASPEMAPWSHSLLVAGGGSTF